MDIRASVLISTMIFVTWYVGNAVSDPSDAVILRFHVSAELKDLLEVRYNGNWGSICHGGFDDKAAKVACRQMGFRDGTRGRRATSVTDAKLTTVLDEVNCTGEEDDFSKCTLVQPTSNCRYAGEVKCESDPALDGLFDVSLLGSPNHAHKGILHATKAGATDAVCYDSGTAAIIAGIVCKQMGYSGVEKQTAANASSYSGFFTATCKGTELTLANCTLTHGTSCSANSVIDIECKLDNATQTPFAVRLSQSSHAIVGASSGTVEVKRNGKWGVICDTGWDIKDANVVCRQLGFKGAVPTTGFPTKAKFGQGTGIVFWNSMNCSGDEQSIAECTHNEVFGTGACKSADASGVICSSEKLPTFDICSDKTITIPAGVSFLRSPGYPNRFHYKRGTTCSCTFTNLNATTNLTLYINQKMFQKNHVESLTFGDGISQILLYGDDSAAGPFSFTNTDNFTIQFESDNSTGEEMLNIQIKAAMIVKVPSTTRAPTTAGTSGTTSSPTYDTQTYDPGMIAAIVIGVVLCCGIIIGVPIWWFNKKKKTASEKISKRSNSVGSFDQTGDGSKQGVHNPNFEDGMKKNEVYETANEKGNIQGGTPGVTADICAEVTPKSKRYKEPETGETNQNGKDRPASGSHVKVCIANPAFNKDEWRPPQHNGSPRALKKSLGGDVKYKYDAQDIDNGNVEDEDDIDSPAMYSVVNESHKSPAFIPGLSTAYEEVGFGGASSMQTQPNEETPEKDEKKKKKKKKKKKDKSEDTNKKKKKRSFGTADDQTGHPDGQRNSGSCAVPITGIYAEAGQKTGSQPDDSEDMYDHLNRKGTTPAPSGCDQIYATAKY